jgi:hypothetical protein
MCSRDYLLILGKHPAFLADGQEDREDRSLAHLALDGYLSVMVLDVAESDAQAKPCSQALLGGEEWVEDLL